ncbi:hypothetical protein RHSIM_Rhsim05G0112500 [Rhododendron simsii]|uniref:Uncharacterized protein n=1 Tax=Rhododendron simsii TaxID=118357 RepID=A0A834GVY2_RHOSS|nr:hypothetical protein RHSIM_Rhsim05G0112500 [Rhododendron simsii]
MDCSTAVENMSDELEFRCFIGGLAWSTSDRGLKDAFAKFGHLVEAKVAVDKFSGRSRGFGFVTFDEKTAMEEAIEAMNGMDLDGRSITVEKAQPSGNVLVKGAEGVIGMVAGMIGMAVVAEVVMVLIEMEIDLGDVTGIPVAMVEAIVIIVTVLDPMTAGVPEVSDPAEEIGGSATGCEAVGSSFSNDTFSQLVEMLRTRLVVSQSLLTVEIWQFQEFCLITSGDLTDVVSEIDKDGNDTISLEEFADFTARGGGGKSKSNSKEHADIDGGRRRCDRPRRVHRLCGPRQWRREQQQQQGDWRRVQDV